MVHLSDRVIHCSFIFLPFIFLQLSAVQSPSIPSSETIVATVRDDVILPCHSLPARGTKLEWWAAGTKLLEWPFNVGYHYQKHPFYNRTSLFGDRLKYGDFSMKLSNVTTCDEGTYSCSLSTKGLISVVELVVGAVPSRVTVAVERTNSGVVLQCESKGWYPKPEVFWLDGEENLLPAGSSETPCGPDGLYAVSSRLTVKKSNSNIFTCRIQQQKIKQTRETQIRIPANCNLVLTGGLSTVVGSSSLLLLLLLF
ncbi:butyrophilin-like protein 2 [Siniperca chuatsi]|uniref:butyrophilin-like protein 2 n=1 Tax=Siniperca chuatsi TaxID=119488 RepID=UPI001CE107A2|nr:butyrophilin-like protein 2 [Siniperca chuatsi]